MTLKFRPLSLIGLIVSVGLSPLVIAQDDDDPPTTAPAQAAKAVDPKANKADEYAKAIKDLPKFEGVLTLFVRKNEILLQLQESDLKKQLFMQTTFNTGGNAMGMQAGDPVGAGDIDVFQFEKHEDALWLIVPNKQFRWDADDPLAIASQRSFPKAILGSFKIEQTIPEKGLLLVNITSLFYGNAINLTELVNSGGGTYSLDKEKCLVTKVKSFSENAVVQMQLHFFSSVGPKVNPLLELLGLASPSQLEDSRSIPLGISCNLWWRKDTGYRPRLFDNRVGYFTDDFFSLGKFMEPDRTEHFINRFQLKKKDPTAKLSEPVKPIVWVIDPSVPEKYRQAVREGILLWNSAFEPLGYQNAVQVIDTPKDPDYDHADGRYNVIRWTMSPDLNGAYAIAQFRTDPFTGEIMNAAVSMDANFLAAAFQEHKVFIEPNATSAQKFEAMDKQLKRYGWSRLDCAYSNGLTNSARFAWNTAQAMGTTISREDFARQLIRETICHEVGHCLGLRHNFKGSTMLTTEELGNAAAIAQRGDTASVMDYTPVNILSALKGNGFFFTPCIGIYDRWAISYGYTDVKATSPTEERFALSQIANQSGKPGLAYMTDENADSWDPYVLRFDYSSDPLNYATKTLYATKMLRKYAIEKLPRPGEGYDKRTALIIGSITQAYAQCQSAVAFIGGIQGGRYHKGDMGERPTLVPVDPKLQRQALNLIVRTCFSQDSFVIPPKVLESMSLDPDTAVGASWNAPIRRYLTMQSSALFASLMRSDLFSRISENELKMGPSSKPYTLEEHFSTLVRAIYSEIGKKQSISPTRRDFQRYVLSYLMVLAGSPSETAGNDSKSIVTDLLKDLSKRITEQLNAPGAINETTKTHLRDLRDTLHRFLSRTSGTK